MLKRVLFITILIALILTLTACTSKPVLPVSPYNDIAGTNPDIRTEVTELTQNGDELIATLTLYNDTVDWMQYGVKPVFLLEKYEDGAWRTLPYGGNDTGIIPRQVIFITPDYRERSEEINITALYDFPGAGEYRIVQEYLPKPRIQARERIDEPGEIKLIYNSYSSAEFTIEKGQFKPSGAAKVEPDIRMEVSRFETFPKLTAYVNIYNDSTEDISYLFGRTFWLEKFVDGRWEIAPVVPGETLFFTYEGHTSAPSKEPVEYPVPITPYYEMPSAGRYRIVKNFSADGANNTFYIAAEFEVEEGQFER
jgi:hypothetical protein